MPDIGDAENTIVRAQNVELMVGSSAGTAPSNTSNTDTLVLMKDVNFRKQHPETRIDHGKNAVWSHATPDVDLTFNVSSSTDVFDWFSTRSSQNDRNVLPTYKWEVVCTADDGSTATVAFDAKMTGYGWTKSDGAPGNSVDINCQLRITNKKVTITKAAAP